jgi:hypothetical protein
MASDEKKQLGTRLAKDLSAKLGHLAIDREISLSDLVEGALATWYTHQPEMKIYGSISPDLLAKAGKAKTREELESR